MGKEGKPGMFFLNISVFFLSTISKEGECSREGFGSPLEALLMEMLTAFYTDLALRVLLNIA